MPLSECKDTQKFPINKKEAVDLKSTTSPCVCLYKKIRNRL